MIPTHLLPASSSCIDVIFTINPNLVMSSGVFPSIYQNCDHQIVFAKTNLNTFYLSPYTQHTWDYEKANHEARDNATANFDWENAFSNINVHTSVILFNKTFTTIFINFVPNKLITLDRDPLWVNKKKKKLKTKIILTIH